MTLAELYHRQFISTIVYGQSQFFKLNFDQMQSLRQHTWYDKELLTPNYWIYMENCGYPDPNITLIIS